MKRIKMITREMLSSWHPCDDYTSDRIDGIAKGRKSIAVKTVFDLPIPAADKVWLLCHDGIIQDEIFRKLACKFALYVIDKWDAPDVVRQYLETGEESLRAAARDAARAAAWDATWAAARAAAGAAAWDAAWAAAKAATRDAAKAAAWAAARDAARDAAKAAAWDAARDAARDAAKAAAGAAAWDATWDAGFEEAAEWQLEQIRAALTGGWDE